MTTIEIPLSRGHVALIDDTDADIITRFSWYLNGSERAYYARGKVAGKPIFMHRLLVGDPPEFRVDHINHDGLDNRRSNLRLATHGQNQGNRRPNKNKKSGLPKGVVFIRRNTLRPYTALIGFNGKQRWLGTYATPEEAASVYALAALDQWGEFACHEAVNLG